MSSYQKEIAICDLIDRENPYHLWIVSFAQARQDLFMVNNKIIRLLDGNLSSTELYYFTRMNVGHLRESIKLLTAAYDSIKTRLDKIHHFKGKYDELITLLDGEGKDSFNFKVLREARDSTFHYNKTESEFEGTKIALQKMYDEKLMTGFILGETRGLCDYYFAYHINIYWLTELGRKYGLDTPSTIRRIGEVASKVMDILTDIIDDFVKRPFIESKGYGIFTR